MKTITFIKSKKAILPEINMYTELFRKNGFDVKLAENERDCTTDIIWKFMGISIRNYSDAIIVHEYASLSTGRFSKVKDWLKTKINSKPSLRVFLNDDVRNTLNFNDDVPYLIRDMGVCKSFSISYKENKDYDYIYCGAIDKDRPLDKVLDIFKERNDRNILVVGDVSQKFERKYKDCYNITFVGKVDYHKIPKYLCRAKVGINIIPNRHPYDLQTSTKILEYVSSGLHVYTTKTKWIESFSNKHKLEFSYFTESSFDIDMVSNVNDVESKFFNEFTWDNIFKKADIVNIVKELAK